MDEIDITQELNALLGRGQRQQIADELAPLLAAGRGRLLIVFEKSRPVYIEPDPEYIFQPDWDGRQFQPVKPAQPAPAAFEALVPECWRQALLDALQQVMGWGWGKLYLLVQDGRLRAIYPVQSKRVVPPSGALARTYHK